MFEIEACYGVVPLIVLHGIFVFFYPFPRHWLYAIEVSWFFNQLVGTNTLNPVWQVAARHRSVQWHVQGSRLPATGVSRARSVDSGPSQARHEL